MFARFQELLLRRRWWVLGGFLVIALGTGWFYPQLRFESSVEAMVLEDDPDLQALRRFEAVFGSDETMLVALRAPDIFTTRFLTDLEALRERIAASASLRECRALTNLSAIAGRGDELEVGALVPEIPTTAEGLAALRARALAREDYLGIFFNRAANTATILVRLELPSERADLAPMRAELVERVRQILREPRFARYPSYVSGGVVLRTDLAEYQRRDNTRFQALVYGLIVLFLLLSFRRVQAVVLPLTVVQISLFIVLAQLHLSGRAINMVGSILTPLLLVYGISISSHVFNRYLESISSADGDQRRALVTGITSVALASLFNAVTTAAGFGSNMISQIVPIRNFGRDAALGVLVVMVVSLLLAGPLLSLFRMPRVDRVAAQLQHGRLSRLLDRIATFNQRWRWPIALVNLGVIAIAAVGISRIQVETKLIEYFREDTEIRTAWSLIEEQLTGVTTIEVVVETDTPDAIKDPVLLAKLDAAQRWFDADPRLHDPLSVLNILGELNRALAGEQAGRVPQSAELTAQLLLLYESSNQSEDLWSFVNGDYTAARLSARIKTMGSNDLVRLVQEVKAEVHRIFAADEERGLRLSVTGTAVLYANMVDTLIAGQLKSFGLSLTLIALLMMLVAREIGLGLLSLLPNLIPIAVVMGIMGYAGIPLDATTATIAPIALGIAVDSTIHYLIRFRREHRACGDRTLAMRRTVATVGRAMVASSLPLCAGFLVLCTSAFKPTYYFGLLSGMVVFLALVYDLVATPVALLLYTPGYERRGELTPPASRSGP